MSQKQRFTRRRLLRASAASAVGLGAVGTANALGGSESVDVAELQESLEPIPPLDVQDETERLESGFPEQASGVRPGSMMFIEFEDGTAGCTANFIWRSSGGGGGDGGNDTEDKGGGPPEDRGNGKDDDDDRGGGPPEEDATSSGGGNDGGGGSKGGDGQLYIGAAGHCFLDEDCDADQRSAGNDEEGCNVSDLTVTLCKDCNRGGANGLIIRGETYELGDVVYARQTEPGEEGGDQLGHDFGLVAVPAELEEVVDPSMPQFGGPLAVSDEALDEGTPVNQYGAGVANGEVYPTMGSNGVSFGDGGTDDQAWFAGIRASPGDSGSPLQSTTDGEPVQGDEAGGILTHLSTLGTAGTTIGRCKEMIQEDIGMAIEVVLPD